jgi:hypothetical protein
VGRRIRLTSGQVSAAAGPQFRRGQARRLAVRLHLLDAVRRLGDDLLAIGPGVDPVRGDLDEDDVVVRALLEPLLQVLDP